MGGVSRWSDGPAEKAGRAAGLAVSRVDGARTPCDKGLGGIGPSPSPLECTAFRLAGDIGCPQCRAPSSIGSRTHRSIAQRFEWRRGRDIHMRNRHAGRSPLKFTARRVGFGGGYLHRKTRVSAVLRLRSPFEHTGASVSLPAGHPRLNTLVERLLARSHR